MIKRFSKKQGSKQGIILLTVVFILAMAVIFISACMLMTQATRNRMYWKAEQSQARLTVTSAAEAFYQALEVGDFKEEDLKKLATGQAAGIFMTAKDSSDKYLPGMSMQPDNCTLLSLKAKDASCSEIYAYLTTTIGEEKESVKITFKMKDKATPYGLFQNPVDYNGTTGTINFDDMGKVMNGSKPKDNFLVVRGGTKTTDSSSNIYSNVIFVGGDVTDFVANLHGDVVFLENAQVNATGQNQQYGWSGATVYFTGSNSYKNAFNAGSNMIEFKNVNNVIFANRTCNTYTQNNKVAESNIISLKVDTSGGVTQTNEFLPGGNAPTHPGTYTTDIKDAAAKYASDDFTKKTIGTFATTGQAFGSVKVNGEALSQTAPDSYTKMSVSDIKTNYGISLNTATTAKTSAGFTYLGQTDKDDLSSIDTNINITSGGNFGTNNKTTPTVYFLDGTKDYIIYFSSSSATYDFSTSYFVVVNPSPDHTQLIVLQSGVKVSISTEQGSGTKFGFLSISRGDNSGSPDSYLTYLKGGGLDAEMTASGNHFSTYYDSVQKPAFMVLGAGSNQVNMFKGSVFEGYLGLYNPNSSTQSYIGIYNGPQVIYGRILLDGLLPISEDGSYQAGGNVDNGQIYMPYCPGPNASGPKPDVELYEFGYKVISVDYYIA
ncbi:MAG: hypothetical protein J5776_06650 [Clostridiales bacterium]|nr:hypothetical protein [Clostridiales bacterium]